MNLVSEMSRPEHYFRWSLATIMLAGRGGQAAVPSRADRQSLFAWAAQTGFEGIELSPRWCDILVLSDKALLALGSDIEQEGLKVSGINVDRAIVVRSANAKSNCDRIKRAIEAAAAFRAPVVDVALSLDWEGAGRRRVVNSIEFSTEEFEIARETLKPLIRYASQCGVQVSLELHDDGLLDDATRCREFIQSLGTLNVGCNPDVGNICRNPEKTGDWEAALVELAPLANCWHVKNYRDSAPVPIGLGEIDYARAIELMIDAGFSGWTSIESRVGDFKETQAASLAYLQNLEKTIYGISSSLLESVNNA